MASSDVSKTMLAEVVRQAISPVVMVISTELVEQSCRKNYLSFADLLRPFCILENVNGCPSSLGCLMLPKDLPHQRLIRCHHVTVFMVSCFALQSPCEQQAISRTGYRNFSSDCSIRPKSPSLILRSLESSSFSRTSDDIPVYYSASLLCADCRGLFVTGCFRCKRQCSCTARRRCQKSRKRQEE